MKKLNKEQLWAEFWRIFRFGVTGTIATLIHYGTYCLSVLYFNPSLSYSIGYLSGLGVNYMMTSYFTFHQHPSKKNAIGFLGSHAINYLLEIGLFNLFLWMGLNQWVAPIIVMVIVVPVNFLMLRFVFVWKKKK